MTYDIPSPGEYLDYLTALSSDCKLNGKNGLIASARIDENIMDVMDALEKSNEYHKMRLGE